MPTRHSLSVVVALSLAAPTGAQKFGAVQQEARVAVRDLGAKPEEGERAVAAVAALGAFDDKRSAEALLDLAEALDGSRTAIVEKRRKGLMREGGSDRLKRTRYELRNIDDALEAIARGLAAQRSVPALQHMLGRLVRRGGALPLWLRLQLAARAAELPPDQLEWDGPPAGGGKQLPYDSLLAILSVTASLGPRAAEHSGPWLLELLQHDNVDVRIAAVAAIQKLAWPGSIAPLVARLEHEQGRVLDAMLDALVVITGENPGSSFGSWQAWLRSDGAPFVAGERELGKGDPSQRVPEQKGGTSAGSYFGIPQDGESILYLIDNSQSMQAKVGGGGTTAGGGGDDAQPTRWDYCKRELERALQQLPAHKRFNLVSFANKARFFHEEMQLASPANIERAIEWVNALELEFETNIYDALELGFLLAGRGVSDRYYESKVDTMFFLSDGAPTIANLERRGIGRDDPIRVLRAVRCWNVLRRVTIHTVGIGLGGGGGRGGGGGGGGGGRGGRGQRGGQGDQPPEQFLKSLAEQNGGRFTERK